MDYRSPNEDHATLMRRAVRARIQTSVESIRKARAAKTLLIVMASAAAFVLIPAINYGSNRHLAWLFNLELSLIQAVPTYLICTAISLPVLAAIAYGHRIRLRRELRSLPPDEIAEILGEPHNWSDQESRRLVRALAKDLRVLGTEVSSTADPVGRGGEVSVTEACTTCDKPPCAPCSDRYAGLPPSGNGR